MNFVRREAYRDFRKEYFLIVNMILTAKVKNVSVALAKILKNLAWHFDFSLQRVKSSFYHKNIHNIACINLAQTHTLVYMLTNKNICYDSNCSLLRFLCNLKAAQNVANSLKLEDSLGNISITIIIVCRFVICNKKWKKRAKPTIDNEKKKNFASLCWIKEMEN